MDADVYITMNKDVRLIGIPLYWCKFCREKVSITNKRWPPKAHNIEGSLVPFVSVMKNFQKRFSNT